ncbi:hypothetical protein [Streptomyces sp. NPDC001833]|uniref:hypothetical protein n=1 Tax=Streptomyces sp. NPDC001833 TaxID=3154658 RepID=UPI00331E7B26
MSKARRTIAAAAVSVGILGAMTLAVSPASAATTVSGTCFGYTGTFNEWGFTKVDWKYGPDECFGVAPSGSIWHTWSGAGGWKEMPGNGTAVEIYGWDENSSQKTVYFLVESHNLWCNTDNYATNVWSGWYFPC